MSGDKHFIVNIPQSCSSSKILLLLQKHSLVSTQRSLVLSVVLKRYGENLHILLRQQSSLRPLPVFSVILGPNLMNWIRIKAAPAHYTLPGNTRTPGEGITDLRHSPLEITLLRLIVPRHKSHLNTKRERAKHIVYFCIRERQS